MIKKLAVAVVVVAGSTTSTLTGDVYEEAWTIVRDNFWDPDYNGIDWRNAYESHQADFAQAQSEEERSKVINAMLAELGTSHTAHYFPGQIEYYELAGIFESHLSRQIVMRQHERPLRPQRPPAANDAHQGDVATSDDAWLSFWPRRGNRPRPPNYTGIGVRTTEIDGKIFVKGMLAGSPAERAGLLVGDQIVAVDGQPFHPIQSFAERCGEEVALVVQSAPDEGSRHLVEVTPQTIEPLAALIEASRQSAQVFDEDGIMLGYVRLWTLMPQALKALETELFDGRLVDADGLVLDLRDGWGGSSGGYLDLFAADRPTETWQGRDGQVWHWHRKWPRPVVVLVNGGSRSAKEFVAYALKHYAEATLVGTRTAGAVVTGKPFLLSDGSLLVVAALDLRVDGIRLEGRGVEVDVVVPFSLPYAGGRDSQRERALEVLWERIQSDGGAGQGRVRDSAGP